MRSNEVPYLIEKGIFEFVNDQNTTIEDSNRISTHCSNPIYLIKIGPRPNDFCWRELNKRLLRQDNTKNTFKDIPDKWSNEGLKRIIKIGVTPDLCVNE